MSIIKTLRRNVVVYLFRLGWFLSFVEDGVEAFVEAPPHAWVLWGRVVLQEAQELDGEPRRRHKVVSVVLKVGVAGCYYLWREKNKTMRPNGGKKVSLAVCTMWLMSVLTTMY